MSTHSRKYQKNIQTMSADISVKYLVSIAKPENGNFIQETDTFDTWFSSSQWPVVALKK